MFFIDSHFKARIEGFVKNSILLEENHDFYNSEIKLKFKIRLREPFEINRFFGPKNLPKGRSTIKINLKIHIENCLKFASKNAGWGE